jgi:hypothetical protein
MENRNTTPVKRYRVADHIPIIVESLNRASTFFLFRNSGLEIEFTTIAGVLSSKHNKLDPFEVSHIKKTILNKHNNDTDRN